MTSGDDHHVARILAEWREACERGEALDPREVMLRNPHHAEALRRGFEAVTLLDRALASAGDVLDSDAARAEEAFGLPARIGDFRILREIGRGGMGVVYEAEQVSMRRKVALKVLYPSVTMQAKAVERFRREAQAAGRLHHTNIVAVHGMGSEDGTWFYAMEWIEGRPLSLVLADLRRLRGLPRPGTGSPEDIAGLSTSQGRREEYARLARAFAGLADALAAAHVAGVIHRDVKPSNVLLDGAGNLKLVDFGLALCQSESGAITATGDVVGTPAYMSPEQARSGVADPRSDVYSLGATLYEVLTHRPPVEGRDIAEVLARVLDQDPPAPRHIDRRIPRDLETIVLKAMEREPARRYATAADLGRDLTRFAEGAPIQARRVGPLGRAWRTARRHRVRTALVVSLLLLSMSASWLLVLHVRAEETRRRTEYVAVLARVAFPPVFRPRIPSEHALMRPARPSVDDLRLVDRALSIDPTAGDAYLARWTLSARSLEERLADLRDAFERGLFGPRALHLARAAAFSAEGRTNEEEVERRDASGLPPGAGALDGYFEAGDALLRREFEAALASNRGALEASGDDPLRRHLVLLQRARIHDLAGAPTLSLEALLESPVEPSGTARIWMVGLWRRLRNDDRAKSLLEQAASAVDPAAGVEAWFPLLREAALLADVQGVDYLTKCAVDRYPGSSEAWFWRARAMQLTRRLEEGIRAAREAVRLDERDPYAQVILSRLLRLTKSLDEARRAAESALALDPSDDTARAELAMATARLGDRDRAIDSLRERAASHPSHPVYHALGEILDDAGRTDDADVAFRTAAELDPLCAPAYKDWAKVLDHAGRVDGSLAVTARGIAATPCSDCNCAQRGISLFSLGRFEEALVSFTEALRLAPDSATWRFDRALTNQSMGRLVEALQDVDGAIQRDSDPSFRTLRASLLLGLGHGAEALEEIGASIAADPTNEARVARAGILLAMGQPEAALAALPPAATEGREYRHGRSGSVSTGEVRLSALCDLERFDELDAACDALLRSSPELTYPLVMKVLGLRNRGRDADARSLARSMDPKVLKGDGLDVAYVRAVAGDPEAARRRLDAVSSRCSAGQAFRRGVVHALLAEKPAALEWLRYAAEHGWKEPRSSGWNVEFRSLEGDSTYEALRTLMVVK